MPNGANFIHKQLKKNLENYIKSQYFGKTPILLSALDDIIDKEGVLYQKPFIESSPAYSTISNGINSAKIDDWLKTYFSKLSDAGLGVFQSPFVHQIIALETATKGEDLFVSTGTGSGKTECFMWPILAKMASEAKNFEDSWEKRGVRVIIMYPMNALVSDQISRLRRMLGDPNNEFLDIFHETCGQNVRRPQFGMYTGRTPYPGLQPTKAQDSKLKNTLSKLSFEENTYDEEFYKNLLKEGKIPAKSDMKRFLENLHNSDHIPNEDDAELITRFEMQQFCPDILITNYSMLEYMLLRPIEQKIWNDTREWLNSNKENKLLFVIDEAHMYHGSSGGEVALLIRRLFHKLNIDRNRVQFILTTASMPNNSEDDKKSVENFANELTASDEKNRFNFITGTKEKIHGTYTYDISDALLLNYDPEQFEGSDNVKLSSLLSFWNQIEGFDSSISSLDSLCNWMYDNLVIYRPFRELIIHCRGNAESLDALATNIFPQLNSDDALKAVSVLLAIAPLAKNSKGAILFPARMHMLFRGISGVYACTNPDCPCSHTDHELTLGEIFLSDGKLICPHCGSVVYELYNDRRCGALFFKGYILDNDTELNGNVYLWHYPGQQMDFRMKEIHLYIPPKNFTISSKHSKNAIKPCYLDIKSGFINFNDDSFADKPGCRKLYYCNYTAKGKPDIITFPTCPHCKHLLASKQLTSFNTHGNQSFYNLIKTQFQLQPSVSGKENDLDRLPNQGRKVLLFSDSRQQAAKLARDMSEASEISVVRQLFAIAIKTMKEQKSELMLSSLYGYFCLAAYQRHIQLFHGEDRKKFKRDCEQVKNDLILIDEYKMDLDKALDADQMKMPEQFQAYLLRMFAGSYNTLYDSATSWLIPSDRATNISLATLKNNNLNVTYDEFISFFNAWILSICDSSLAIGDTISNEVRSNVRSSYNGYGLKEDWEFSKTIRNIMQWEKDSDEEKIWKEVLSNAFLSYINIKDNTSISYVKLSNIKPCFDPNHSWYRCKQCSELTPYTLRGKCPSCGSEEIYQMKPDDYAALGFWKKLIDDAITGKTIQLIDTEEHTAQLSHKDQRDDLWSKTEQYELRFRDLVQNDETPIDILSSTTTMEVGIDIGSLVAVGLRNIPPMRENYQQRAGRAGRRGSSLSTIITFCEDGPHDTLYFNNPIPMFRGDPRRPWIDIRSEKLLQRHLAMVTLQEFLKEHNTSLDTLSATSFLNTYLIEFENYLSSFDFKRDKCLLPKNTHLNIDTFICTFNKSLLKLKDKCDEHPELFTFKEGPMKIKEKSLLDALYEEGIIPTYSFPKNVVSTYISNSEGKISYEIERGLDIAIGEYAPGRAIVVDKQTYQIGGFFYPGSERTKGNLQAPAYKYVNDPNYVKEMLICPECGWFGIKDKNINHCPFCGNKNLTNTREMLRPWGFAPKDGKSISEAQLTEEYSCVQQPLYSTLPEKNEMKTIDGCNNIRIASRTNQRIIMLNQGNNGKGFMVCKDCGAAMPGNSASVLQHVERPYSTKFHIGRCLHKNCFNVNLGYDFITDMLVLEFKLENSIINTERKDNPWIYRAGQSLAEALRLVASKKLDIEFNELVTGYRLRSNVNNSYIDVYLYDSLSSGAGYAISVADSIAELLEDAKKLLSQCDCESACSKCLKHYQNQYIHGNLDRFAALQLLEWGIHGTTASPLSYEYQKKLIEPLTNILEQSGCRIFFTDKITIQSSHKTKKLIVYPAMWAKPYEMDTIYISDATIKYAKPYAVQKILDNMK